MLSTLNRQNLIIQLGALPGYILGIFLLDPIGRKRLQMIGEPSIVDSLWTWANRYTPTA